MADLDAEILALAGGDESSDEGSPMPTKEKSPSPQPTSPQHHHHDSDDAAEMGRKGTAKVAGKGQTTRKARRVKRADSEDGEAYVATSLSPKSVSPKFN